MNEQIMNSNEYFNTLDTEMKAMHRQLTAERNGKSKKPQTNEKSTNIKDYWHRWNNKICISTLITGSANN